MKKWMTGIIYTIVAVLVLAACGSTDEGDASGNESGNDSDYEEAKIRLAYNLPQDHHISVGIEQFAKDVTEKSGGKVKIDVYPAGQLLSDKDMNQSILSGWGRDGCKLFNSLGINCTSNGNFRCSLCV